jgi:hypothetical protein
MNIVHFPIGKLSSHSQRQDVRQDLVAENNPGAEGTDRDLIRTGTIQSCACPRRLNSIGNVGHEIQERMGAGDDQRTANNKCCRAGLTIRKM